MAASSRNLRLDIPQDHLSEGISAAMTTAIQAVLRDTSQNMEIRKAVADALRSADLGKRVGEGFSVVLRDHLDDLLKEEVLGFLPAVQEAMRQALAEVAVAMTVAVREMTGIGYDTDEIREEIRAEMSKARRRKR